MQFDITGHHVDITQALDEAVRKKMDRVLKKIHNVTKVHVILSVQGKHVHAAEIALHVSHTDINAKAESDDMYTTIDAAVDKLDKQVTKWKEKHQDHH